MNKILEYGCVNWIGSFARAVTKLKVKYDKKQYVVKILNQKKSARRPPTVTKYFAAQFQKFQKVTDIVPRL